MAELNRDDLTDKYDDLFEDNSVMKRGPEVLREFRDDIRDSFALVSEVKPSTSQPVAALAPVLFTDKLVVNVSYTSATPPPARVFDQENYTLYCQERCFPAEKRLEFTFSEPTSGKITF